MFFHPWGQLCPSDGTAETSSHPAHGSSEMHLIPEGLGDHADTLSGEGSSFIHCHVDPGDSPFSLFWIQGLPFPGTHPMVWLFSPQGSWQPFSSQGSSRAQEMLIPLFFCLITLTSGPAFAQAWETQGCFFVFGCICIQEVNYEHCNSVALLMLNGTKVN